MLKKTPEEISARREEIVNACERLYASMSFKDITLKEIGQEVPFSRPTIYNYFQTKEEIFLALFEREYVRWNESLEAVLRSDEKLSNDALAARIAETLSDRMQLLRLLSMNNYDMESNSRAELLTDFKKAYGRSMELVREILAKFRPDMTEEDRLRFVYIFFPFMFGIYPYASVTDKQREAMTEAGVDFSYQTVYEITYGCLIQLLGN